MLGKSFSHYRVLDMLGQGGMGVVYLAEDTLLGRRVAIKFPHAAGPSQRLLSEARTASSLNHPAIAAVYDCGIFEDHPYVVMEYVEGENLGAILARGPLPPRRALEIAGQAAAALAEAHSLGIVHRDIKPANIQIDRRGAVKVLDFGIATSLGEVRTAVAGDDPAAATRTIEGTVTGTPRYMSPEQARGGRADARTDLFALGLVFWECLTGKPAFAGQTAIDTLAQVLQTDPAPPSSTSPAVPPILDRICAKALAKDPADRYQSAAALLEDLESARHTLADLPAPPLPPPPASGPRRAWRRYGVAACAVCLLAAAAATAAVVWGRGGREPDPQALRWYQEGANAIRDATYFKAANALERAVSIDPAFALAHARLADASDELDDATRAREEVLKAVAPDSPRSRLSRLDDLAIEAIRRTLTNDAAGAAAVYRELLARSPESEKAAVYLDLGRACEKAGQPDQARACYLEAARRSPQYAAAFLRLGVLDRRAQRVAGAERAFAQAESLYRSLSNAEGLTEVLYQRGVMANKRGEVEQAASVLSEALALARTTGNPQQQIAALLQLSNVETHHGDAAAERHANEATDLAHARGLEPLAAAGLLDIGNAHFVRGGLSEAKDCFMRSLEMARHAHAPRAEARALLSLGSLHIQQANFTEGIQNVEQALRFYQQGGDSGEKSVALVLLGRAHRDQGDYAGALRAFREQLDMAAKSGNQAQLGNAREGVATVLELQERYPEALAAYQEAAAAAQSLGDKLAAGYALASSARVLARLGRYTEAREALAEASAIAHGPGGYDALARLIDRYRSEIALSQRQFSAARDAAHKLLTSSPDKLESADAVEAGDVYCTAQSLSGARRAGLAACQSALDAARKSGVPRLVSGTLLALAEAQLENGDAARAKEAALSARSQFSASGQAESEARASLIAARAARAMGDAATARQLAVAATHSLAALSATWPPDARPSYDARPDVRQWHTQLTRLLSSP
jgi:tetratricopeptide (TPR) repeat protein/predicted Ser/Thr protein kinase